jgi:hypothetical protein
VKRTNDKQTFDEKETTMMEKQNDQTPGNGQIQIEDLTVNQDQAAEVSGGQRGTFHAYQPGFIGGVYVASGD